MALTTLASVRQVPGLQNVVRLSDAWLEQLIAAADTTIKGWCKQQLELAALTEYYDGNEQPDIVLRQFPVWSGSTQVAAGSDGVVLPTATINVATTLNPDGTDAFDPDGRSAGQNPTIAVQTGPATWTVVSYTGKTSTSFTGCSGGTGTLSSTAGRSGVSQPVVHMDTTASYGQAQPNAQTVGPFGPLTVQVLGANFGIVTDRSGQGRSKCGLLRRIGGLGPWNGFFGGNAQPMGRGKLSSNRAPCWPRSYGGIKVQYSAGYSPVPADLVFCANSLIAGMVRNQPKGAELASESLGAYSYSIMQTSQDPDIATVRSILAKKYTEVSW